MTEPEPGREYVLFRREGGQPVFAKFLRFEDGSGIVRADGTVCWFDLDQTTWRRKWAELLAGGYIEVNDAVEQGLLLRDEVSP